MMKLLKKIYRKIYSGCTAEIKGFLTGLVSHMPGKPSVKQCRVPVEERFPDNFKGALVISADFEMAWAWRYAKNGVDPVEIGLLERANVPGILQMLDEYRIPVTWATVGHLFLRECRSENNRAHPSLNRIPYFTNRVWRYESGDWFDHDPCSNLEQDPAWYAPDLIKLIIDSNAGHEIACHTFSHLDCTDLNCPKQVMEDEIKECVRLAEELGISLKSMVFPGGTNGNYDILRKNGFTNVRLNSTYDLFYPEKDESGLWVLPSSEALLNHGFGWSAERYRQYYSRYMDKAISSNSIVHLWFHPSIDEFCLNEIFPAVFDEAHKRSDGGDLWVITMEELADYCQSHHG